MIIERPGAAATGSQRRTVPGAEALLTEQA